MYRPSDSLQLWAAYKLLKSLKQENSTKEINKMAEITNQWDKNKSRGLLSPSPKAWVKR